MSKSGKGEGSPLLASFAALLFGLAVSCAALDRAFADNHDSPAEKRMNLLVGFPPAGGHDLEARIFARYLPKYIPGASVIVQNMPGAGGAIMATHMQRRVKPDGQTLGILGRGQFLSAILESVEFDPARMPAIWGVSAIGADIIRADTLKVKVAEDLRKVDPAALVIAGRSRTDVSCVAGRLAFDLLGIKGYKTVCAYPGTAPMGAAMQRGEVSFIVTTANNLRAGGAYAEMVDKGMAVPLWQTGAVTLDGKIERSRTMGKNVPTLDEVYRQFHGKPPSGVMWDAYRAAVIDLSMMTRIHVVPPGTPKERIASLRQAFSRMTKDPAFVRDWERIMGEEELASVAVSAELAENLKNNFMKTAPWQEFLRKYAKE
ncbi:MAG TPA: hypothetical protein VLA17_05350 [Candidatus Limnocylindria bacterium]|nr:hypothetical protein [Candidatus Limnocylindria bacterium]